MMSRVLHICLVFSCMVASLSAVNDRYQKYLKFIESYETAPDRRGSYKKGEIEIVRDLKEIQEIEDMQKAVLMKRGYTKEAAEESSRIGVITEDTYWIWVRDGVIFPTGAKGTYNRIVWKRGLTDAIPRVGMLPINEKGKIVLNLNYRHALRKWTLEIPRGFIKEKEPIEEAVKRQLKEETGYELKQSIYLGEVSPDSGSLSSVVPIYLVYVGERMLSNQDYTEAILRLEEFTLDELKKAIADGGVELEIKGTKQKVALCDAYLAYALIQSEAKGLIFNQADFHSEKTPK